MSFTNSVSTVVEVIGYITSIILILAPMRNPGAECKYKKTKLQNRSQDSKYPTKENHKFWKIFKKKHVEEKKHEEENISGLPYLAILFNCIMWVIYRLPNVQPDCHCTGLLIINIVGICFQLLYLAIVLVFSRRNRVTIVVLFTGVLVFTSAFSALILSEVHTHKKRIQIVGIMCVFSGIIMYASTIPAVIKAWIDKNIDNVPLLLTLAGSANTAVWLVYAILHHDMFILIQNVCGLLLCIVQLIIYGVISNGNSPPTPSEA